ncbi:MAG: hypothetical protein WCX64_02785 [Candidatus Micrarchaeia archaeon]|jgi:hypothetical protein
MERNIIAEAQLFATFGLCLITLCASTTVAAVSTKIAEWLAASVVFGVVGVFALIAAVGYYWKYKAAVKKVRHYKK